MSIDILSSHDVAALEAAATARDVNVDDLLHSAIQALSHYVQAHFRKEQFPTIALLVGSGHNGADALGAGCELLNEGRKVTAVLTCESSVLKPATARLLDEFNSEGGRVIHFKSDWDTSSSPAASDWPDATLWLDGIFGFGFVPQRSLPAHLIAIFDAVNRQKSPVIAIDIPSGLSCDVPQPELPHIKAHTTLALGALKPVHVDDTALASLGDVHFLDLNLSPYRHLISAPRWHALEKSDLLETFNETKRAPSSHKISNGRVLIVAGSKLYPGAAVLACLGAGISGAGMIHALVPDEARGPLLNAMPEIIFERTLPDLASFRAVVLGPGWVPADTTLFEKIVLEAKHRPELGLVLDAGAFAPLAQQLSQGRALSENIVITPHTGEFARLFPEISARLQSPTAEKRIQRLEAAAWAAHASSAVVLFKGARTHIAAPDKSVASILRSSPLLAHAGQGDVLAGLIGGLMAAGHKSKKAATRAALLQAETALWFSSQNPSALTLPPSELVRLMPHLPLP
ncbi:MAG: hypothetical protein RIR26_1055 [Pseudomonadota bacterium]|jgi:NAD(P)H-hydrate epimerase